ncbi:MAG TPA: DUF5916 domain-containing protein [Vicinamibacterales bacterium]|nr:DUF5916 domain-containing protein [Vicinamibacterales bacterium]
MVLTIPAAVLAATPAAGQSPPAPASPALAAREIPFAYDGPPAPVAPDVVSRDAEGRVTVRAHRLEAPLKLDGALDEAIYHTVPSITDFIQVEPDEGVLATEKTEAWLAFDREYVYVAFRCWESEPERRVATEMRRDNGATWGGNDVVSVFFDTFYDRRNGIGFTINSIGGRNDGQITNERQYSSDWNPIWDFATGRFEEGWTVEIAIPFKSLRYRDGAAQIWGFNALRAVRWKNELSLITKVPAGRGMQSVQQSSMAATMVGLEVPGGASNLDVKPYATMSLKTDRNGQSKTANDLDGDIGIDAKYGLTQSLSADFTYNTDFAQVEADEAQVNLTRFSLFFPEKREFFLENQGTFSFGGIATTGQNAGSDTPILFYSRQIGLDQGQVVPIQAGGRVTGRAGRFSMGLLNIQTGDEPTSGDGAANFSVIRVKRDILRRSSVGLLFTGRSVSQVTGEMNAAAGVDGTFGFYNNLSINTYWARTHTDGLSGNDTSYRAQLDYNADRYGVQLEHLLVGDTFNPEVGYVRRDDMRRSFAQMRFSPRPSSMPSVRRLSWTGSLAYIENLAGRVDLREQNGEFAIEFLNTDRFSVAYTGTYEFLPRPFEISDGIVLPIGSYDYDNVKVGWNVGQQRAVSGNFLAEYGTFYSGTRTALSASRGRLNLGPQIALEPTYTVNWVDLAEGSFTTHLAGARVTYTMSPRMFVSSLLQYTSSNEAMSANVRLRWEYQPGSELFVVYNEERDTAARAFPSLSTRALIVKVNRLWRF